jgi:hypothetical protein
MKGRLVSGVSGEFLMRGPNSKTFASEDGLMTMFISGKQKRDRGAVKSSPALRCTRIFDWPAVEIPVESIVIVMVAW